jgi:hypothetical protein
MPGMDHVGAEFRAGNMFVPEVLRSARAMQLSMDILRPLLAETGAHDRARCCWAPSRATCTTSARTWWHDVRGGRL